MTPNFSNKELECRCGCGALPSLSFMMRVQKLRNEFGRQMLVSSAKRCPDHNDRVSSTGRDGPHTKDAIDILIYGEWAYDLLALAIKHGFKGVGVQQKGPYAARFIHLDDLDNEPGQPRPRIWSY